MHAVDRHALAQLGEPGLAVRGLVEATAGGSPLIQHLVERLGRLDAVGGADQLPALLRLFNLTSIWFEGAWGRQWGSVDRAQRPPLPNKRSSTTTEFLAAYI